MTSETLQAPPMKVPTGLLRASAQVHPGLPTRPLLLRSTDLAPQRPSRRDLLIGAAGLLLLPAGCGSSEGSGSDGGSTGDAIRVEHAGGTTEVPRNVERVATLDGDPDLHTLLALGVTPVVAAAPDPPSPLLKGRLDGVEWVFERTSDVNLERLAAERLDLIFGAEYHAELYEKLSQIAPTVLLDRLGASVDEHVRTVARPLARQRDGERIMADLDERFDEVARVVGPSRLATMPLAMVEDTTSSAVVAMFGRRSFAGRTLAEVGVAGLVEPPAEADEYGADLSVERFDVLASAELLIVVVDEVRDQGARPVAEQPLWRTLPAVQAGAVEEVLGGVWIVDTVLTLQARLDDIEHLARRLGRA